MRMHAADTAPAAQAGVIFGSASAIAYDFAVTDGRVRRLDYVTAETPDGIPVLGQVMQMKRESSLSYDEALTLGDGEDYEPDEKVTAHVMVLGFRDDRGLLQVPRTPFRAGATVRWAGEDLIRAVLGLEADDGTGAYIGRLRGTGLPVQLHINTLVQKHVSVLAKTGAGKSYATGVLLEELLKQGVAIVIIDAHDEYQSLSNPNIADSEVDRLIEFGLKPKGFSEVVHEWTTEMNHRAGTDMLKLEGTAMEPAAIMDLLGGRLTGAQQGILYQAIKDARLKNPLYSLRHVIDMAHANKSNSKWNVISALEALDSTGFFAETGIEPKQLVEPGHASIVSLKGVPPDVQEVIVARLATLLFDARKATEVPPFLFVVEEAHNYCPERGIGNAVSLGILRTIASEGRKFGMGLCVVTQRPAKVDKNVLSQCNTQIILKVTNPNDLKAIVGSVEGLTSDSADEIARLPVGVALVAGGSLGMPVLLEVRTRQSRHGGAGVDVIKGQKTKAEPRMLPPTPMPERALPPRPDATEATALPPPETPPARKAKKTRAKPTPASGRSHDADGTSSETQDTGKRGKKKRDEPLPDGGGRSEREIKWGAKAPEEAAARGPANGSRPPASVEPKPLVHDVAARDKTRPTVIGNAGPSTAPDTPPQPTPEPRDVRVHRVANRVGYVATLKPEETLDLLRKAAARGNVAPNTYLDVFGKVGRSHCHREDPDCEPCPLGNKCAYKAKRDAQGKGRERGVIGRFFRR